MEGQDEMKVIAGSRRDFTEKFGIPRQSGLVIGSAPAPAGAEGVVQLAEGYLTARALAVRLIAQFDTLAP